MSPLILIVPVIQKNNRIPCGNLIKDLNVLYDSIFLDDRSKKLGVTILGSMPLRIASDE